MKRIKISIALITMFGLLGTAGVISARTISHAHTKVSQTSTKTTHPLAKSKITKSAVHKSAKNIKDWMSKKASAN